MPSFSALIPPPHPAPPPPSPLSPAPPPSMQNNMDIVTLNLMADLDFFSLYNQLYRDLDINDDPYYGLNIPSGFHDPVTLYNMCSNYKSSVFLSINIQSLLSKHEQLVLEIAELEQKNIVVDVIALQETWDIKYPELVVLDGFNPVIFKRRRGMRGGGVGFYIKKGIHAEIVEEMSPFENKIIEALTVKIMYPDNKSMLLTSIYRSNSALPNVTASQQMDRFMENSLSFYLT
jgi:hypothetical protein